MIIPLSIEKYSINPIIRHSLSSDAGFYRLVPKLVVYPHNTEDIRDIFAWAHRKNRKLTFRAAGTSLSGQAVSDDTLVDLSGRWNKLVIENNGTLVTSEPGVIGGKINERLRAYHRKLGPDPASINSCMIGGMIANNSSGMRSGIVDNVYNSIISLKYILPNGLLINSSEADANVILMNHAPDIFNGITDLRNEIINNTALSSEIVKKFSVKNTIGYSINAFLDYSNPADILKGLMIGSEGTLGFIAEAQFRTLQIKECKYTGLIFFDSIVSACKSITNLRDFNASAIEILDRTSIEVIKNQPNRPGFLNFSSDFNAMILFEIESENTKDLKEKIRQIDELFRNLNGALHSVGSSDENEQARIWSVRQGLLPLLGKTRPAASTLIIEDLAFPLDDLSSAIDGLRSLLIKYKYDKSAIYGHGLDGNIHFICSQNFDQQGEIDRYKYFMEELADFVVMQMHGSLKAEHGTGRNMAPYVEKQWGSEIYGIMKRIKNLIDPDAILNPNVIISADKVIHLKNIKSYPVINTLVDSCIECGFCESVCPSRDITLSPRKRIVLARELSRSNGYSPLDQMQPEIKYYLTDTCAVDGMCSLKCPVDINTGELVKYLRFESNSTSGNKIANIIADNFKTAEYLVGKSLSLAHQMSSLAGESFINSFISGSEKLLNVKLYDWTDRIGLPADLKTSDGKNGSLVYFPCCMSRIMGKPNRQGEKSLAQVIKNISEKSGISITIPDGISGLCCGMSFSSKGYKIQAGNILHHTLDQLYEASDAGNLPVFCDMSSCAEHFRSALETDTKINQLFPKLNIMDSVEFVYDYILPVINPVQKRERIVIHPSCAVEKMGLTAKFIEIMKLCSEEVYLPFEWNCCGYAGDRGLLFPELTKSALRREIDEVLETGINECYSTNLPCETGLSQVSGLDYKSYLYLVEESIT